METKFSIYNLSKEMDTNSKKEKMTVVPYQSERDGVYPRTTMSREVPSML